MLAACLKWLNGDVAARLLRQTENELFTKAKI